jgi:hypothetical protein
MTWKQIDPSQTPWDGNRASWMSQLPDDLAVQDLSVPGTHDSAALLGFTHANVSVTQNMKIEDQLNSGVRFLDLRVKIMFSHRGLAMYHGIDAIYDPDHPHTLDQLYYKAVIQKCVDFLKARPNEGIIISLKSEGDTEYQGWTLEDWFRQIANEVAADNPPGTWDRWWKYPSNVNAKLKDIRGKLLLWRRFPRGCTHFSLDTSTPFALDLTPMNVKYDNTTGASWYTPDGGYSYVQDNYTKTTNADKFSYWYNTYIKAFDSRWMTNEPDWNRQYINFSSVGAGKNPSDYSDVLNVALNRWLAAVESGKDGNGNDLGGRALRTGVGVIPMDFPTQDNIDHLIRANFGWTHRVAETQQGLAFVSGILDWVKAQG